MKILIKAALLSTVIFLSWQALSQESAKSSQSSDKDREQLAETKRLFTENCIRCHGDDGRGKTTTGAMLDVPDFTDEKWWQEDVTDERLAATIHNGKGGMPKFEKKLSDQQIASLIKYVRAFNKSSHEGGSTKP
ncbi:MAG TPA: cytochrome c [Pyrinomonadaceae bacterium]|nr:cytochrome c [Pyrinomonadaceae bacterium]